MNRSGHIEHQRTSATLVYVVLTLSLQVFLLVVALEAFQADEESLAWPAAALSTALFLLTVGLARLLGQGGRAKNRSRS